MKSTVVRKLIIRLQNVEYMQCMYVIIEIIAE